MKDNTRKIGGAILIGGLIGAAIALQYAPERRAKNSTVDLIEDTIRFS